jgi:hypothetical protein
MERADRRREEPGAHDNYEDNKGALHAPDTFADARRVRM